MKNHKIILRKGKGSSTSPEALPLKINMEKVKTLKDCKDKEEAREQAIKWVKRNEKEIKESPSGEYLVSASVIMKTFCNIKEKDLK